MCGGVRRGSMPWLGLEIEDGFEDEELTMWKERREGNIGRVDFVKTVHLQSSIPTINCNLLDHTMHFAHKKRKKIHTQQDAAIF